MNAQRDRKKFTKKQSAEGRGQVCNENTYEQGAREGRQEGSKRRI
jgi:hypothetical protein